MNMIKTLAVSFSLAALSFTAVAAEKIQHDEPALEKMGTISVRGASSAEEVEQRLSQKADSLGATKFRVVLLESNDNSERGTAVLYK